MDLKYEKVKLYETQKIYRATFKNYCKRHNLNFEDFREVENGRDGYAYKTMFNYFLKKRRVINEKNQIIERNKKNKKRVAW